LIPCNYFNHAIAFHYLDGKLNFADMTKWIITRIKHSAHNGVEACAFLLIKNGNNELMRFTKIILTVQKIKLRWSRLHRRNEDRSAD